MIASVGDVAVEEVGVGGGGQPVLCEDPQDVLQLACLGVRIRRLGLGLGLGEGLGLGVGVGVGVGVEIGVGVGVGVRGEG